MLKITLRVPLDQPTLTQKKMNLKLAKHVTKEPRKASWIVVCADNEICTDIAEY